MAMVTLVVGNGFSISLAHHLGIADSFKTDVLIPSDIPHYRLEGSHFAAGPLWRRELVAGLWDEWERFEPDQKDAGLRFRNFCAHLSLQKAVEFSADGSYSFSTGNPTVKLRTYLWFMFVHFEDLFIKAGNIRFPSILDNLILNWSWTKVIYALIKEHEFVGVSFNYDTNLEKIVGLFCPHYVPNFSRAGGFAIGSSGTIPKGTNLELIKKLDRSVVLIIKPHGSILHNSFVAFGTGPDGGLGQGSLVVRNQGGDPMARTFGIWPPDECPTIPDIVPPGHGKDHFFSADMDLGPVMDFQFKQTDVCIFCGLSGRAPDDCEIKDYIGSLQDGTKVIHVGLASDQDNDLAKMLKSRNFDYQFVESSQIGKIPEIIGSSTSHAVAPAAKSLFTKDSGEIFNFQFWRSLH